VWDKVVKIIKMDYSIAATEFIFMIVHECQNVIIVKDGFLASRD